MDTSIMRISNEGGAQAARPYRQTPLDFIDDLCPSWSLNVQTFIHMPIGPFERPISRFGNDRFPYLKMRDNALLFVRIEQILWRLASMIFLGSTAAFWTFESIAIWYRYNGGELLLYRVLNKLDRLEDIYKLQMEKAANPRKLPLKANSGVSFYSRRYMLLLEPIFSWKLSPD